MQKKKHVHPGQTSIFGYVVVIAVIAVIVVFWRKPVREIAGNAWSGLSSFVGDFRFRDPPMEKLPDPLPDFEKPQYQKMGLPGKN